MTDLFNIRPGHEYIYLTSSGDDDLVKFDLRYGQFIEQGEMFSTTSTLTGAQQSGLYLGPTQYMQANQSCNILTDNGQVAHLQHWTYFPYKPH